MRKILTIFMAGVLVLSIISITSTSENNKEKEKLEELIFSTPYIEDIDEYVSINVEGSNSVLLSPGRPILPVYKKTFTFPFGTRINDVVCKIPSEIGQKVLPKKIVPASEPVYPGYAKNPPVDTKMEEQNYITENPYPGNWFDYNLGCGLKNGENVLFLTMQFYPVRYVDNNMIHYTSSAEIKITYEEPENPVIFADVYDLLIIAPDEFSNDLERFVDHKEEHDVMTKLVTLSEIYQGDYFPVEGRDDAEKIKYFIKNAFDEWGIKYVLLAGGRKPGLTETWFVPVRYVKIFWVDENRYISDLYFADIYDSGYNFSSWDTDNNEVYSEWPEFGSLKDEINLYPDVYVGRWACRSKSELKTMIQKTMKYENKAVNKKVILIGGDNFEDEGIEGEIVADKALTFLPGFSDEKIYASMTDITPEKIRSTLGTGAAFMFLHGHGSPHKWSTHKPDNFDQWEKGLSVMDLPYFFNSIYPIGVFGGCHTAMFNVSVSNHPYSPNALPEGLNWWFTRKVMGGGIASLGHTCFPAGSPGEQGDLDGDGINEPDCVESGYGYLQLRLFYAYGIEGMQNLGDCWGYAVSDYVEHYTIPYERWHLHTIQGWVLLGDPSLKIRGYSQNTGLKAEIINAEGGIIGYPGMTVQFQASASGGTEPYEFEWEFEDGNRGKAHGGSVECTWNTPGVYWVSVKVTDGNNDMDTYDTIVVIESKTPKPSGPTVVKPGVEYSYTAQVNTDPSWDQIYYFFDWGDEDYSYTLEPCLPDEPIEFTHIWSDKGVHQVKVKALLINSIDDNFEEMGWSDPLPVTVPRGRLLPNTLFLRLLERFPNAFPILRHILGL